MFPLWLATVIIFCFLSGYWLWKVINSFFYYDKKKSIPVWWSPSSHPPAHLCPAPPQLPASARDPLPLPSIQSALPLPSISLAPPSACAFPSSRMALMLSLQVLAWSFQLIQVHHLPWVVLEACLLLVPNKEEQRTRLPFFPAPLGAQHAAEPKSWLRSLAAPPQLGYLLRYWWTGRICLLCSARQEMFNE